MKGRNVRKRIRQMQMSNNICLPLHSRAKAKAASQEVKDFKGTAGDVSNLDTSTQTAKTIPTDTRREKKVRKAC